MSRQLDNFEKEPVICSIEGCENGGRIVKSWCKMHYTRFCRTGDPLGLKSTRGRAYGVDREEDMHKRFMEKLEVGEVSEDGLTRHLLFMGYTQGRDDGTQYGRIFIGHKGILAHRYLYEKWIGPIEEGLDLDHRSECPKNCVNPAHLTPMTRSEHMILEAERRGDEWNSEIAFKRWEARRGQ